MGRDGEVGRELPDREGGEGDLDSVHGATATTGFGDTQRGGESLIEREGEGVPRDLEMACLSLSGEPEAG